MTEQKFTRIRPLLVELARRGLGAVARHAVDADSVLLGVPAAQLLLDDDPALYAALRAGFEHLARLGESSKAGRSPSSSEPRGHRRRIYHALVLHLHLTAFNEHYERLPGSAWGACEDRLPAAVAPARCIEDYGDVPPPADEVDSVLWHALCLLEQAQALSREVDIELIDAVVHQAISVRPPDADDATAQPLGPRADGESLDIWTYRELSGLHALANLALSRRNTTWARRVEGIALHHLEHTQPDYTTTEPWGVFAFAWSDKTQTFAEQQIHDATVQAATEQVPGAAATPEGTCAQQAPVSPVSAMLLADAAHAMGAFEGAV